MPGPGFWKHGGYGGMGFLHKYGEASSIPAKAGYVKPIDCPERKQQVHFIDCLECEKFRVWHPADGDMKRCWYEFKDLKSEGLYNDEEYLKNADYEPWKKVQEQIKFNEEVNRELESERIELERRAEELASSRRSSGVYEYYWEHESEEEDSEDSEDDEKPDQSEDEDDEEDF